MKYCTKCKVSVTGNHEQCPLCQGDLSGAVNGSEDVFPVLPKTRHPYRIIFRLIQFGSIAAGIICLSINLRYHDSSWWSLIVLGGLCTFWLAFMVLLKQRKNILKNILWQAGIISAASIAWDLYTGFRGWSVDFVIPIFCTLSMITMAVIARVLKLRIQDYIIYLILCSIFGIIQLILLLCNVLTVEFPSIICFSVSVISLAALLIFEGDAMKAELRRRMHL